MLVHSCYHSVVHFSPCRLECEKSNAEAAASPLSDSPVEMEEMEVADNEEDAKAKKERLRAEQRRKRKAVSGYLLFSVCAILHSVHTVGGLMVMYTLLSCIPSPSLERVPTT